MVALKMGIRPTLSHYLAHQAHVLRCQISAIKGEIRRAENELEETRAALTH